MKENGKRNLEVVSVVDVDRYSKKLAHVPETFTILKDSKSVTMERTDAQNKCSIETDHSMKDKESVNIKVSCFQSIYDTSNMNLGIESKKSGHVSNRSMIKFSKKRWRKFSTKDPAQSYQKLVEGKNVSFYRKKDLSTITMRILSTQTTKETCTGRENYKKKKRRRCPRKRTTKIMEGMNCDTGSSESLSAPSICDNLNSFGTQILQIPIVNGACDSSLSDSLVIDNATSSYKKGHCDSNVYQPFVFSAFRDKDDHETEKKRIRTSKKKYSQGDESPRHSLSTCSTSRPFSRNFLRPRGVSVSCCRYSSTTQLIKKRKDMSFQLVSSERPRKKPTLFATLLQPNLPDCLVIDNTTSSCSQARNDSNERQPFVFSAFAKKYKMYSSSFARSSRVPSTSVLCRNPFKDHGQAGNKMLNHRKNYRLKGESPRHILSTSSTSRSSSRKFLRPCGVSVSCCRYSSAALLVKKRKPLSLQLASSERPLKKPILLSTPMLSLISCSNSVIIKSDSESRVSTV